MAALSVLSASREPLRSSAARILPGMSLPADIRVRPATPSDAEALLEVEREAFGGPDEADLVAVAPGRQHVGIGSELVEAGLLSSAEHGFELALVLGDPAYYTRFGFEPAAPHGIEPPYPVEPAEAWMALELSPGAFARASGTVRVANELMHSEMWRE